LICSLSVFLYAQTLNISYPLKIDTLPNQTINIPVVCENLTNEIITVFPDYFSMTYDSYNEYKINRISPRPIAPGRKELIFISLHPNINMTGGRRYFPFALKNENSRVLATGFFEIEHIVNDNMDIIPLSDYRYIIPDIDDSVSFLLHNKGSVPVEFKTTDYKISRIIQPGGIDTLVVKLSEIESLEKNDFWVNFKIEYLVTTIFPNDLQVTQHTLHRFIPVAYKTAYPKQNEYYEIPVNVSQYIYYEESRSSGGQRPLVSRQHRTSVYGSGYIDDYPSPYIYYRAEYTRDNLAEKKDTFSGNLLFRSETFAFEVGEGSYLVDLKNEKKYGNGLNFAFQPGWFLLENTYLQELYGNKSRHNATTLGIVWDRDSYLYEPQQFIRYRYYIKNVETKYDNAWYTPIDWETTKQVVETQIKLGRPLTLHFEIFTAEADSMKQERASHAIANELMGNNNGDPIPSRPQKSTSPGFTTELLLNTHHFYNRFSMIYDEISVKNETDHRKKYQNDMNINTGYFDLYTAAQYQDEMTLYPDFENKTNSYDTEAFYAYANIYIRSYRDIYIRAKGYENKVNVYLPSITETRSSETMGGLMYKKDSYEIEGLFGYKKDEHKYKMLNSISQTYVESPLYSDNIPIIDANFTARRPKDNIYNISINNRITLPSKEVKETTVQSFLSFFNNWSSKVSQSTGIYNHYNTKSSWRNYFSVFSYANVRFPWEHELRFGGSYSLNPTGEYSSANNRFSVSAEYSMPLSFHMIPKSNKKYLTVSVFDPWEKKPVSNAVFDIDNHYYVTNDSGLIRPRKSQIASHPIRIINLPDGFTTIPELSTLSNIREHTVDLRIIPYSKLTVQVRKQAYERISPQQADNTENIAYYRNTLVNLDKTILEECSDPIEIILRRADNPFETHRQTLNQQGYVIFDKLSAGEYIISLNENTIPDLTLDSGDTKITIEVNKATEHGLILQEKVSKFIRYE